MGALLYAWHHHRQVTPLGPLSLVGRAATCLARIPHPACPAHWLELRWNGKFWSWRALAALDRTRGAGRPLPDGWHTMEMGAAHGTRVALGTEAWVELIDAGPPEPFVWDVIANRPIDGDALDQVVERRGGQLLPLSAEGDERLALEDGQHWIHHGDEGPRTLRAHVPANFPNTLSARIDLRQDGVDVLIDLGALQATFRQRGTATTVQGSSVRTLLVYGRAQAHDGGWLTAADAWAAWVALGGNETLSPEAVAWDRARLRRQLDRAGVGGLEALFEQRKDGAFVKVRLRPTIDVDWLE